MANWSTDVFYIAPLNPRFGEADVIVNFRYQVPEQPGAFWRLVNLKSHLGFIEIVGEGRWGTEPSFTDETWDYIQKKCLSLHICNDGFGEDYELVITIAGEQVHTQTRPIYENEPWIEWEGRDDKEKALLRQMWREINARAQA